MRFRPAVGIIALSIMGICAPRAQVHQWSFSFGDMDFEGARSVAVDPDGNIVIAGTFEGSINFGGGWLTSMGANDIYLAKLTPDGSHIWSRSFGDADIDVAGGLDIDALGYICLTGYFLNTINFGAGPMISAGSTDIFVAKFHPGGACLWSRSFGDAALQAGRDVAAGDGGSVILTGYFTGTVDFGGGILTSNGEYDVFLARFDSSSGFHMWSASYGDAADQIPAAVAAHPQGRILLTGITAGTIDFGAGPLASAGGYDVFLAKFESFGAHIWSRIYGDAEDDFASTVGFVPFSEEGIMAGHFHGGIDLGGGSLISAGSLDVFVSRFDSHGAHQWSSCFGDADDALVRGLGVNPGGDVALTGHFGGTIDFGGGPLASAGGQDVFLATFDGTGAHEWSLRAGDGGEQFGRDVAFDDPGDLLAVGDFENVIDFGGGPLVSFGGRDVFLAKLRPSMASVGREPAAEFAGLRVWPHPTGSEATLGYAIPHAGHVRLTMHDLEGRRTGVLVNGWRRAGRHEIGWQGETGRAFLRLELDGRRIAARSTVAR